MKDPRQNEQRRLMMMNEPIHKVVFKMAFPTIIAFLITSVYSLADTYFVSGLSLRDFSEAFIVYYFSVLSNKMPLLSRSA